MGKINLFGSKVLCHFTSSLLLTAAGSCLPRADLPQWYGKYSHTPSFSVGFLCSSEILGFKVP